MPEGVLEMLGVAPCDPLEVTVGVPVTDAVKLPLGVKVSVRLCDCVSEGVPVADAVAPCDTLCVCVGVAVADGVKVAL